MLHIFKQWYSRKFSDPNSITLLMLTLGLAAAFYFFGTYIIPVMVALVIAYLLDWPVQKLMHTGVSRVISSTLVMLIFSGVVVSIVVGIIPVLWHQLSNFVQDLPSMLEQGKGYLMTLPSSYPELVNPEQVKSILSSVEGHAVTIGQTVLSTSLNSLKDVVAWLVYLILVPLLVFFMLKDKHLLLAGFEKFIPKERKLISQVWQEMNQQIMNYIRGKIFEILIVGSTTFITFTILDLRYAALLGTLVGFSVLIPFVGAALVTIPVALVALFQFGVGSEFWYVIIAYGVIQALDGNLLVPLLFSEAVDLHPVYIIVAVLFFGGLWGFWGVFFAIPLASLVRALLNAWSMSNQHETVKA
ncbi:AI-2E family transporter [Pseudoalteromonas spongiae]|uniref:AI-2E family transporter n=1 Tax=Pseudoalteromonas spongiae TaxID=298657 RepID=A0ABU8ESD2_9GAMM